MRGIIEIQKYRNIFIANNPPGITVLEGEINDIDCGEEPDDRPPGDGDCRCWRSDVIIGNPWGGGVVLPALDEVKVEEIAVGGGGLKEKSANGLVFVADCAASKEAVLETTRGETLCGGLVPLELKEKLANGLGLAVGSAVKLSLFTPFGFVVSPSTAITKDGGC